ncbi:flagellar basal body P-ring formation chaperone FlgA [Methylobacterium oryzae CBMB20]
MYAGIHPDPLDPDFRDPRPAPPRWRGRERHRPDRPARPAAGDAPRHRRSSCARSWPSRPSRSSAPWRSPPWRGRRACGCAATSPPAATSSRWPISSRARPERLAARPLFRAPALGATGTIQTRRIVDAAAALGLNGLETGGRLQIAVQRAARRLGPPELEAALKRGLESGYGLDPRNVAVRFDGDGPTLLAPLDLEGQAVALDLTYDARTRRVAGLVSLGERQASQRVSGVVVELREVAVLARNLNRGEPVKEGDVTLERRPREAVAPDAQGSTTAILGEVAQNTLTAGTVLRVTDTAPPELVARGENVTIVYETPSISPCRCAACRGRFGPHGRRRQRVVNVASKKILQATVIGPGRVSVSPSPRRKRAAAGAPVQATASLR